MSLIFSIFILNDCAEYKVNPFENVKEAIKEIETIGDLILIILLIGAWLITVLLFGI